MEGVAEQSGEWNKWKRSDIGTAKLVRIQGSPFATRGKVGAAVTNRNGSWKWEGSRRRGQRHEENHGPHPLTAKSWYTAQFRSCYSTFHGGEHYKLVSFSRRSYVYGCECEWNRNNTRFIMPLSGGLWGRQLVAGGSNHFPQLGRFEGVFCVGWREKVSIRGHEFSILFRPYLTAILFHDPVTSQLENKLGWLRVKGNLCVLFSFFFFLKGFEQTWISFETRIHNMIWFSFYTFYGVPLRWI